jgi:uncharacterized protein (TIGR02246 family)
MRQSAHVVAVVGLGCLLAGCQPKAVPLADADVQALRNDSETWVKAVTASDWAKVASLYTTDATLMPPNEAAVNGRAKIQAWMGAFPKLQDIKVSPQQIDGRGDMAYVSGTYTLTIAAQGPTPAIPDNGKFLEIRRKQPDGKWAIAYDMFSSNMPVPPPAPASKAPAKKPAAGKTTTKKTTPKR